MPISDLELPPHHLVDDACVALDYLHHLAADRLGIDGDGDTMASVGIHCYCCVNGLKE